MANLSQRGYDIVRGVVPDEVLATVRGFLEGEVLATVDPILRELGLRDDADLRDALAGGRITNETYRSLGDEGRKAVTGHFRLEARLSPVLHAIPRATPVLELLRRVLGSERVRMHLPPVARFVHPGNRLAGVPAHRDAVYNGHMTDFVTMWVPLVPIDRSCGGVTFFTGVGPDPAESVQQNDDEPWLSAVDTRAASGIHHAMTPGDVLLFDKQILHQSAANTSDRTRLSIDFRFFGELDATTKPFLDLETGEAIQPETP